MFRLYWQTVAAVPHGDDRVLKVGAVGVEKGVKLGVNPVIDNLHRAAHMVQSRAGVVADLLL